MGDKIDVVRFYQNSGRCYTLRRISADTRPKYTVYFNELHETKSTYIAREGIDLDAAIKLTREYIAAAESVPA